MRKTLIAALTTAALLGSAAAAQAAATTVDGNHFAASGVGILSQGCEDPRATPDSPPRLKIAHKGRAPLGDRFIGWDVQMSGYAVGPRVHEPHPSTNSVYRMKLWSPGARVSGLAVVTYTAPDDEGTWIGTTAVSTDAIKGWHTVDASDRGFTWQHYVNGVNDQSVSNSDLASFVTAHGGDNEGADLGFAYGCDGNDFFVDSLAVGRPKHVTTYDFEGFGTHSALSRGSKKPSRITIDFGTKAGVSAELRKAFNGKAMAGKMRLDSRSLSSKKWTKRDSFKVSKSGKSLRLGGSKGLAYRLHYAGNTKYEANSSKTLKILVRSKVSSRLVDDTVTKGHSFTTTGRVRPGRAAKVVLQRYIHHKWTSVKSGRSGHDGKFRISMTAKSVGGSYWRVKVGSGGGNVGNNSKAMKLTVNYPPQPPSGGGGGGGGGGTTPPPPPPPDDPPPPPPPSH